MSEPPFVEPWSSNSGPRTRRDRQPHPQGMLVWMVDPPECDGRWPAMIVERRQIVGPPAGEAVRVVYALDAGRGRCLVIDRWLGPDTSRQHLASAQLAGP